MSAKVIDVESMKMFHLISFILCKHKCRLDSINLDTGDIDIVGKSEKVEMECYYDMQKVVSNFLLNG